MLPASFLRGKGQRSGTPGGNGGGWAGSPRSADGLRPAMEGEAIRAASGDRVTSPMLLLSASPMVPSVEPVRPGDDFTLTLGPPRAGR